MQVVIELDSTRLAIYEYISETEKLYKVKSIDKMKWANRGWKRQVNKNECLYKGELTDIGEIVDKWNDELDKEESAINFARANRKLHTDLLKEELSKKSL